MKIRLLSDLHQEFYEDRTLYKSKGEDVLVIAGDLAVGHLAAWSALKKFKGHTEHVIYVPGNHEYYNNNIADFDDYIRRFSKDTNIHFLNPGNVTIKNITFVGATLWTNFQNDNQAKVYCARAISDFGLIKDFSTDKCVELNTVAKKYFNDYEQIKTKDTVYITHFLPTTNCIAEEYKGEGTINKYFANDLSEFINYAQPEAWLFGHTHSNINITQGKTRLIANPYGYNKNNNYKEILITL